MLAFRAMLDRKMDDASEWMVAVMPEGPGGIPGTREFIQAVIRSLRNKRRTVNQDPVPGFVRLQSQPAESSKGFRLLAGQAEQHGPVFGPISGYREPDPILQEEADEKTLELLDQAQQITDTRLPLASPDRLQANRVETGPRCGVRNGLPPSITPSDEHKQVLSFARIPGPEGQVISRVTPEPRAVTLLVATSAHGQVRVTGLARLFPARTVYARDCGVVVDGNDCELQLTDHYHVRTVNVSLEPLTRGGSAGKALAALLRNPSGNGIARFQDEMRRLAMSLREGDAQASLPVASTHMTVVDSAAVVQQGNDSQANVTARYVIEEVELPVCDLLAEDRDLIIALIRAVQGSDGALAADFAEQALRAAARTDDLALLNYCSELYGAESSVGWLFGTATVTDMPAVMIGDDNQLVTRLRVEEGEYIVGGGLAVLDKIRHDAGKLPAASELEHPSIAGSRPLRSPGDILRELTQPEADPMDTMTPIHPPITGLGATD